MPKITPYMKAAQQQTIIKYSGVFQRRHTRVRCCECGELISLGESVVYCYPNTKLIKLHKTCVDKFIKKKISELRAWKNSIIKRYEGYHQYIPKKEKPISLM